MKVSNVAYVQSPELSSRDALFVQVAALLHRICASLGSNSCGWLTDIPVGDPQSIGEDTGLTAMRVSGERTLIALNSPTPDFSMTKDEMAAVAAFQRAAWTPSLQRWPLTAWSKQTAGMLPQTTVCIPLHGPSGTSSVVFVPLGKDTPRWFDIALMYVGPLLEAERELRSVFSAPEPSALALTDAEIDSLKWAARGKTAWESARIQGIPERTVVQRLKRVREKLGVGTTALAIGIATRMRIVEPN